jgi:hypothetical protein
MTTACGAAPDLPAEPVRRATALQVLHCPLAYVDAMCCSRRRKSILECADVIGVVEGGALWWRALERRLERRQGGTRLQHHRAQLC